MNEQEVFERVVSVLVEFAEQDVPVSAIRREMSLEHDLGLSSLSLVDLTLALEDAFELEEFPMQSWVDVELEKGPDGFLVGALVDACATLGSTA